MTLPARSESGAPRRRFDAYTDYRIGFTGLVAWRMRRADASGNVYVPSRPIHFLGRGSRAQRIVRALRDREAARSKIGGAQ